jgi:hypothetical protein
MTHPTDTTKRTCRRTQLTTDIIERTAYEVKEALTRAPGTLTTKALKEIEDVVLARSIRVLTNWTMADLQHECKIWTHMFDAVQFAEHVANEARTARIDGFRHRDLDPDHLGRKSGAGAREEMNA